LGHGDISKKIKTWVRDGAETGRLAPSRSKNKGAKKKN